MWMWPAVKGEPAIYVVERRRGYTSYSGGVISVWTSLFHIYLRGPFNPRESWSSGSEVYLFAKI